MIFNISGSFPTHIRWIVNYSIKKNKKYEFIVYPVNQTATERGLRIIRPRVKVRKRNWGYFIDLTLMKTNKDIGGKE